MLLDVSRVSWMYGWISHMASKVSNISLMWLTICWRVVTQERLCCSCWTNSHSPDIEVGCDFFRLHPCAALVTTGGLVNTTSIQVYNIDSAVQELGVLLDG